MKGLGLALVVGMLLLSATVSADLQYSPKEVNLTIEQGGSANFMLTLSNTQSGDVLIPEGNIEDWISFTGGNLYEFSYAESVSVKVTVDVPDGTDVGDYTGAIGVVSDHYSEIPVSVRVVPTLNEIRDLQYLRAVNRELQETAENISRELSNTRDELSGRIAEVSQYQQNLTGLESELADIREKAQGLEKENIQLTGQAVVGGSTQLAAGVLIGIVIVILFLYRRGVARSLGKVKGAGKGSGEVGYRGWKPS